MRASLALVGLLWACGGDPKPPVRPKPPQTVIIYRSCLDNPALPAKPILKSVTVFKVCGTETCMSNDHAADLADYLDTDAYYHKQLEALCDKQDANQESP